MVIVLPAALVTRLAPEARLADAFDPLVLLELMLMLPLVLVIAAWILTPEAVAFVLRP